MGRPFSNQRRRVETRHLQRGIFEGLSRGCPAIFKLQVFFDDILSKDEERNLSRLANLRRTESFASLSRRACEWEGANTLARNEGSSASFLILLGGGNLERS